MMQEDQSMENFSPMKTDLLSPMKKDREEVASFEKVALTPEEESQWKDAINKEDEKSGKFD